MGLGDLQNTVNNQGKKGGFGGGGGGNFTYTKRLEMKGGSKRLRFNGGPDEPLILLFHSFKTVLPSGYEKFDNVVCALPFMAPEPNQNPRSIRGKFVSTMKDGVPHPGCVFCFARKNGDKRIGGASERAVFAVLDCEFYHDVPNQEGKADRDGNVYVNEWLCQGAGRCQFCKSTETFIDKDRKRRMVRDRHRGGQCKWELAMKGAEALWGQYLTIRQWCACCWPTKAVEGIGEITTLGYNCAVCEATIDLETYAPEKQMAHVCVECGTEMVPLEVAECSNGCEGARRASIFDGDWRVTRTGTGTSTSFTFTFMGVSDMESWMLDCQPPELIKEERPMGTKKAAEKCSIPDPFQGQQVANHSTGGMRGGNQGQQRNLPPPRQQQVHRHEEDDGIVEAPARPQPQRPVQNRMMTQGSAGGGPRVIGHVTGTQTGRMTAGAVANTPKPGPRIVTPVQRPQPSQPARPTPRVVGRPQPPPQEEYEGYEEGGEGPFDNDQ